MVHASKNVISYNLQYSKLRVLRFFTGIQVMAVDCSGYGIGYGACVGYIEFVVACKFKQTK